MADHQHEAVVFIAQADVRPLAEFYRQVLAKEPRDPDDRSLVTPLALGYNCYESFAIMPHGSKVGSERTAEMEAFREWSCQLATSLRIDYVAVSWGDHGTRLRDNEDAVLDVEAREASPRALPRGLR